MTWLGCDFASSSFSGGAAGLPDQELHQRLEQRHLPERPPRLLQAGTHAQLGQAQSARWVCF